MHVGCLHKVSRVTGRRADTIVSSFERASESRGAEARERAADCVTAHFA